LPRPSAIHARKHRKTWLLNHSSDRHHRVFREWRYDSRTYKQSPRTTKLYDRTGDEITLDEVERIVI
jgi:hypothetical protein